MTLSQSINLTSQLSNYVTLSLSLSLNIYIYNYTSTSKLSSAPIHLYIYLVTHSPIFLRVKRLIYIKAVVHQSGPPSVQFLMLTALSWTSQCQYSLASDVLQCLLYRLLARSDARLSHRLLTQTDQRMTSTESFMFMTLFSSNIHIRVFDLINTSRKS